jgi:hypothetical protein
MPIRPSSAAANHFSSNPVIFATSDGFSQLFSGLTTFSLIVDELRQGFGQFSYLTVSMLV